MRVSTGLSFYKVFMKEMIDADQSRSHKKWKIVTKNMVMAASELESGSGSTSSEEDNKQM